MTLHRRHQRTEVKGARTTASRARGAAGRKALEQIKRAREAILAEAKTALESHEHLLRLAVNEAESLAWQTSYPHLVFPALANEKVQEIIAWESRQQSVRRTSPTAAFAE